MFEEYDTDLIENEDELFNTRQDKSSSTRNKPGLKLIGGIAIVAIIIGIISFGSNKNDSPEQAKCAAAAQKAFDFFQQTNSGENLPLIDATTTNKKDSTAAASYRFNYKSDLGLCFIEYIVSMQATAIDTNEPIKGNVKFVSALVSDITKQQTLAGFSETFYPTGSQIVSGCSVQTPGNYDDLNNKPIKDLLSPTQCTSESEFDSLVYDRFGIDSKQSNQTPIQLSPNNLESNDSAASNASAAAQPSGEKCVTESGVKICDLSYSIIAESGGVRSIEIPGNVTICHDLTLNQSGFPQNANISVNSDPQFCVSDYGSVYIDPTVNVAKYLGTITSQDGQFYSVPPDYNQCIWTYVGGSGAIPYIQAEGSVGPETSYWNVHAFCQNGSNQVDIYSSPN